MAVKKLEGICAALCTPFDASGERVDESALRTHIDSMLEAGVHIILVCGGTGEFAYLRPEERRRIAELAARHIDGRAGFMVQTSAIATAEAVAFARHAEDLGADALLVLPPYFEGAGPGRRLRPLRGHRRRGRDPDHGLQHPGP